MALHENSDCLRILKVLEDRDAGIDIGYAAWFWVGALGLNKLLDAGLSTFLYWLCFMALNIPIRSQLSAVIFCKTLLRKDVKGSQKVDENSTPLVENGITPVLKDDEDEGELKTLKQGKVNLLAIDATRIADVASFSNIFTESIFGILMYFSNPLPQCAMEPGLTHPTIQRFFRSDCCYRVWCLCYLSKQS